MTTTTRRPPWERLDNETDQSWQAFVTYRDMGLDRSLAKAARALGKSTQLLERWSQKHQWRKRVTPWDREQDRLHLLAMTKARAEIETQNLRIAGGMKNLAIQAMAQAKPGEVRAGDIARLIEIATKVEQLVLGQATERLAVVGDGGAKPGENAAAMSDEERRARMVMLQRELEARLRDAGDAQSGDHTGDAP